MELLDGQTRRHLSRTRDHLQRNVRILENRLQRNVRILITIPFLTGITLSFHHFFFHFITLMNGVFFVFFFSNFYLHYKNVSRSFYHPDTCFIVSSDCRRYVVFFFFASQVYDYERSKCCPLI